MNSVSINNVALLCFTLLLAGGQLLFKQIGLQLRGRTVFHGFVGVLSRPEIYAAFALYGGATFLWIWILSRVPLSQAYPWVALGVVAVPALSVLIFHDVVRPVFWVGAGLIVSGIVITQYGAR